MKKTLLTFALILMTPTVSAENKSVVFQEKFLALAALPLINKDYYSLEFGFLTKKKSWNYEYNAFVTATLIEDWLDQPGNLRAAALGFKGGVILPTQQKIPLYGMFALGFAKTVLHKNPLFGPEEQTIKKKDRLFVEASALYKLDNYLLRMSYQKGTVRYFHRHFIISVGVTY